MGSYEEWVVDREVEAAWLQFRVRLADYLVEMQHRDRLDLSIDMGDRSAAVVMRFMHDIWVDQISATVLFETDDGLRSRPAPGLRKHGFRGGSRMASPQDVDELVLGVEQWLRTARSVPHPSFIDVTSGDLVLVDPPQDIVAPPPAPEMPESITPTSQEDMQTWLDRVIKERIGRPARKNKDGSVSLTRDGNRVTIRLDGSRPIIEVWAVVASDVDVRRARKSVARMSARFHFFAFALVGDRVFVSTTVNGNPFCPAHLDRAVDSMFEYLESGAPDLQAKLARRAPKAAPVVDDALSNAVDTDLLLVFGASADRSTMVEMARGLAGDSRTQLGQWRNAARGAADEARAKAALGGVEAVQSALIDQVIAWRSVAEALERAVAEIVAESGTSR